MDTTPDQPPRPHGPPVSKPLARNIDALMKRRLKEFADEGLSERLAARIAAFAGSMASVVLHGAVFGLWILANVGVVPGVPAWDPSLVVLAMVASVEAIFLTTFVLMNQNRLARVEEDRSELTLQISLLAEHETTRLANLVTEIARHLKVPGLKESEIAELNQDIAPEAVLDEIKRRRPD